MAALIERIARETTAAAAVVGVMERPIRAALELPDLAITVAQVLPHLPVVAVVHRLLARLEQEQRVLLEGLALLRQ